jgi:hypothetical protein
MFWESGRRGWTRDFKRLTIATSVIFSIIGAILTGLATNDSDACVSPQSSGIFGTILTAIGVILAAVSSRDVPAEPGPGFFSIITG